MKKISLAACCVTVFGLVIAVGSVSFLGPCVHDDGSFGPCHWAGQGMLGIGLLLTAQSILAQLMRRGRAGALFSAALTAVLGALLPGGLIGLCGMATMRCRALMRPAMILLCAAAALISLAGGIVEYRKAAKDGGTKT